MIIDTHADTISRIMRTGENLINNTCHIDLTRARHAGIGMQVLSLYTSEAEGLPALRNILAQIDYFETQMSSCGDLAFQIMQKEDLLDLDSGRIGIMLHLEGGEALGGDIEVLHMLKEKGVRSVGLTWNHRNKLGDGVLEKEQHGLTPFGRMVVHELNSSKMLVDLAHLGQQCFYETLDIINRPPAVSHANASSVLAHPRNLKDDQLLAIRDHKGIVCATFVRHFITQAETPDISDLIRHIRYIADLIGVEYIGLGSDFDGSDVVIPDVTYYPALIDALAHSGFSKHEVERISKGNFLRVLNEVMK